MRKFVPTAAQREAVAIASSCGVPHDEIRKHIRNPATKQPISDKTFPLSFEDELKHGREIANGMVAQSLFRKAIGSGNQSVTAAIFWLKTRAGWREVIVNENVGPNGGPQQINHEHHLMDEKQLQKAYEKALKAVTD